MMAENRTPQKRKRAIDTIIDSQEKTCQQQSARKRPCTPPANCILKPIVTHRIKTKVVHHKLNHMPNIVMGSNRPPPSESTFGSWLMSRHEKWIEQRKIRVVAKHTKFSGDIPACSQKKMLPVISPFQAWSRSRQHKWRYALQLRARQLLTGKESTINCFTDSIGMQSQNQSHLLACSQKQIVPAISPFQVWLSSRQYKWRNAALVRVSQNTTGKESKLNGFTGSMSMQTQNQSHLLMCPQKEVIPAISPYQAWLGSRQHKWQKLVRKRKVSRARANRGLLIKTRKTVLSRTSIANCFVPRPRLHLATFPSSHHPHPLIIPIPIHPHRLVIPIL